MAKVAAPFLPYAGLVPGLGLALGRHPRVDEVELKHEEHKVAEAAEARAGGGGGVCVGCRGAQVGVHGGAEGVRRAGGRTC